MYEYLIRKLLFVNKCIMCRKTLNNKNKICKDCCMNLRYISSLKKISKSIKEDAYFLWSINSETYKTYWMFQKGRGSVYKTLMNIVKEKVYEIIKEYKINRIKIDNGNEKNDIIMTQKTDAKKDSYLAQTQQEMYDMVIKPFHADYNKGDKRAK